MSENKLIKTSNLCKQYQRPGKKQELIDVLVNISLDVDSGSFVALTGKSGCGKTTLLQLLGLLDSPTSGQIVIDGQDVSTFNPFKKAEFRLTKIGFIFQSYQLMPDLTAQENVQLAGKMGKVSQCRKRARELLERVDMLDRASHRPAELSGGEQQRVAIARALINNPTLILADEPTGNLDALNSDAIMSLLKELNRDEKKTVLMVTHNQKLAEEADRVYKIDQGSLKVHS